MKYTVALEAAADIEKDSIFAVSAENLKNFDARLGTLEPSRISSAEKDAPGTYLSETGPPNYMTNAEKLFRV